MGYEIEEDVFCWWCYLEFEFLLIVFGDIFWVLIDLWDYLNCGGVLLVVSDCGVVCDFDDLGVKFVIGLF